MCVDRGAKCNDFGDKHLLYILFGRPTSVQVYGGSTLSDADVELVPIKIPGSHTLQYLDTAYWIPTKFTNTLYLSALKLYSGFLRASYESL